MAKDHWNATAYQASASFVPLLTQKIFSWLDPRPDERIVDLGCGDGVLTREIAKHGAQILGLDASPNLIEAARRDSRSLVAPAITWQVQDCRDLTCLESGSYDKIFSNAALHWILRDHITCRKVCREVHRALRAKGAFVFEMGGAGNVAEVHAALISALVHHGISMERARAASPWFFPSENFMQTMLEENGFVVAKIESEYRPTRLTETESGGLQGWVQLMGHSFLEMLESEESQQAAVQEVCNVLESILRHEDGSMWLGYVRLRVSAIKAAESSHVK